MRDLKERVADLVRFNKDPSAIAEEAIALIRADTLEEAEARIAQLEAELTIQYQDGHHDGYEKGCTISKEASERYDRIDARIEKLEAALRWIDEQRYVDRSTINQDNAFRKAVSLNEKLVKIMDTARTALEERT